MPTETRASLSGMPSPWRFDTERHLGRFGLDRGCPYGTLSTWPSSTSRDGGLEIWPSSRALVPQRSPPPCVPRTRIQRLARRRNQGAPCSGRSGWAAFRTYRISGRGPRSPRSRRDAIPCVEHQAATTCLDPRPNWAAVYSFVPRHHRDDARQAALCQIEDFTGTNHAIRALPPRTILHDQAQVSLRDNMLLGFSVTLPLPLRDADRKVPEDILDWWHLLSFLQRTSDGRHQLVANLVERVIRCL